MGRGKNNRAACGGEVRSPARRGSPSRLPRSSRPARELRATNEIATSRGVTTRDVWCRQSPDNNEGGSDREGRRGEGDRSAAQRATSELHAVPPPRSGRAACSRRCLTAVTWRCVTGGAYIARSGRRTAILLGPAPGRYRGDAGRCRVGAGVMPGRCRVGAGVMPG